MENSKDSNDERPRRPRASGSDSRRGPRRDDGAGKRKKFDGERPRRPRQEGERKPFRSGEGKKSDSDRPRRPREDGDRKSYRSGEGEKLDSDRPRRPRQEGERKPYERKRSDSDRVGFKPRGKHGRDAGRPRRERSEDGGIQIERAVRPKIDFPPLPENVLAEDLHISVRAQLKTLSQENQEFVARHLQMVALMIDDDPALAHRHALAASKKGGRIAIVREALGITAYTIGDYTLALRELLTHRRISGSNDQLPLIIDCERGLGRPERAIEAAVGVDRSKLEVGVRINLAVALSGARLDLGQLKAAQQELEIKELSPKAVYEQSPLLFRSYAEILREQGKDGAEWEDLADRAEKALAERDGEVFELIEELELPKPRPRKRDADS